MQRVTILGSTGSVGGNTLDVISRHRDRFELHALTAHRNVDLLEEQCRRFEPRYAVMLDEAAGDELSRRLSGAALRTAVRVGREALSEVATAPECDCVMAAIVGSAGLEPTLAAVESGKRVLLANKESLVMSGAIFMDAVRDSGAELLPIDSEHNAIFQCLPADGRPRHVRRILLTGSGGPLLRAPIDELPDVNPDRACAHPNWEMGRKISVDSATMMNKGLEVIEATWLFGIEPARIEVVIHPESIVHSMVEYLDGSVLAQLGSPDMRTPIANGLAWPDRIDAGVERLDFATLNALRFEEPDEARYPCLRLAREALGEGGTMPAVLNAANEVAVQAFLDELIRFTDIPVIIEEVLSRSDNLSADTLPSILEADQRSRAVADELVRERRARH